jgi:hypothetical protein
VARARADGGRHVGGGRRRADRHPQQPRDGSGEPAGAGARARRPRVGGAARRARARSGP